MSDDSELKALVVKLYNRLDKIEHSPALNGGFSTLSTDVKNLMVDVKKMNDKVEKIYDPEEGLYPRITKMEISLNTIKEKLNDHKKEDEKQAELNETTKQLQMVGGNKLEKLESSVSFYQNLSKFSWIIIGAFGIQLANIILTLLKK